MTVKQCAVEVTFVRSQSTLSLIITMDRMKLVCSWKVNKITKLTNYTKCSVLQVQIVGFISILRFVVRRVACTLTSGAARFVDHSEVCCE